jgi:hypothetical protein
MVYMILIDKCAFPAGREDAFAGKKGSLARHKDDLAGREDSSAERKDASARQKDGFAGRKDSLARRKSVPAADGIP